MRARQLRHRPRSQRKLKIGMLSYQAIAVLHCGHRDPGRTMDSRRGRRWMQTFKKLPMTAPTSTATITDHCGLILPPPKASRTRRVRAPIVREPPVGDKATDRSLTPFPIYNIYLVM